MEWTRSWTREISTGEYAKIGITLDEQDITRILAQELPGVVPSQLSSGEALKLLVFDAEMFITAMAVKTFNYPDPASGMNTIQGISRDREALVSEIKARLFEK